MSSRHRGGGRGGRNPLPPHFNNSRFIKLPPPQRDSVAITTTAKEKTTPNFSPSPHLVGQQPFLTASPPHFTHFYRQIITFYLFSIYLYQLSPSHYTSDDF